MSPETHSQMASFIWDICNLLRGPYKRNEYRKVILPLTVLRRFDCILAPTKQDVLTAHAKLKGKSENIVRPKLCEITSTQGTCRSARAHRAKAHPSEAPTGFR